MRYVASEALAYVLIALPVVALWAATVVTAKYLHPIAALVPAIPATYATHLAWGILVHGDLRE